MKSMANYCRGAPARRLLEITKATTDRKRSPKYLISTPSQKIFSELSSVAYNLFVL
jgi:hypothetical protein